MNGGPRIQGGAALLTVLLACSGEPAPRPPTTPVPSDPVPAPAPPVGATPSPSPAPTALIIAAPAGALAPWLQSVLPDKPKPFEPLANLAAVGWGARSVVAFDPDAAAPGWFGAHLDHGAAGPLGDGDTVWVGIGARGDQVFLATADDRLLAAPDLRAAARPGGAVEVGSFPGASIWAAAPGIVAVGHGDQVSVSTDGRRFRSAVVARGRVVTQLAARHDGVLVAITRPKGYQADMVGGDTPITFVSRGGGSWQRSRWQPQLLEQDGAWITDTHPCDPAVLAAGSTRWVQIGKRAEDSGLRSMTAQLAHARTGVTRSRDHYRTALVPPPPRFDPAREATYRPGDCGGRPGSGIGYPGRPFAGTDVLRRLRGLAGAPPPPTATGLALLADGECKRFERTATVKTCGSPVREPHALAWNRAERRARVLDLPPGCRPALATAAGGLALLHCVSGPQTALHALGAAGQWIAETTIPSPGDGFSSVALAADGTLLLVHACEAADVCRAWVRAPRSLGNPGAWRELGGGAVYRVLPGGAALVVSSAPAAGEAVSVTLDLDRPGQPRQRLLAGVAVDVLVRSLEIDNGTVVVDLDGRGRHTIATDGSLLAPATP